jgi:hypothetical protein
MMWWMTLALADDVDPEAVRARAFVAAPLLGRPVLELRGGWHSGPGAATICGEVHAMRWLAIDACGTGSKLLHDRPVDEMSHYRLEVDVPLAERGRGELRLQPSAGFAEVQRGADADGFRFGRGVAPGQNEAAGAEVGAAAKGRWWVHRGVYGVSEVNVGVAYIPGAPVAVGSPTAWVPSASWTLGLGF